MASKRLHNGKWCRYYIEGYIWVSSDGTVAGTLNKNGNMKNLTIKHDCNGKYVINSNKKRVSIARAVITCYCPPYSGNGSSCVIHYKDGNRDNCDCSNLEWITYHYQHSNSPKVKISFYGKNYTVCDNGTILKGKDKQSIYDHLFDPDMNLESCIEPYISVSKDGSIHQEKVFVDSIMKRAGYVQGDDANLVSPVILHKDYDWMNFKSSNLEWTEATNQRYLDYQAQKKKDMRKRSEELNKGRQIPDYWI